MAVGHVNKANKSICGELQALKDREREGERGRESAYKCGKCLLSTHIFTGRRKRGGVGCKVVGGARGIGTAARSVGSACPGSFLCCLLQPVAGSM